MIVVADTGPLHYLGLIDQAAVLETMFGQVVVPASVAQELSVPQAPEVVRTLIQQPPSWLVIANDPEVYHDVTQSLGRGEQAAISLAHHTPARCCYATTRRHARPRDRCISRSSGRWASSLRQGWSVTWTSKRASTR